MNARVVVKKKQRPLSSKVKSNNIFQDKKNNPLNMKRNSSRGAQNELTSPSHQTSNLPSVDRNNRSKSGLNESNENKVESFNEEYSIIQRIWNNLGVTYKYKVHFDNYIKSCSEAQLKSVFANEKKNLKRLGEALVKLSKEINARENNIHSLKRYINSLVNSNNYFEDDENEKIKKNRENIIMNIISLIKSLRLNSVNTVTHFLKVREIVTYYTLVGKIDLKEINKDYKYDENYLNKMKNDMLFLNEYPQLSKYFDINFNEIDAFLTNFAPKSSNNFNYSKINSHKAKIPVSDDLLKVIYQCRYFLLQEGFFNDMKLLSDNNAVTDNYTYNQIINNDVNNISKVSNNVLNTSKKHSTSKIQFFKDDNNEIKAKKEISYIYNNNYNKNIEEKDIKKFMGNNRYENENMNRNLDLLRKKMGKDYNLLFLKNNKKNFNNDLYNNNNNLNVNGSEVLFRKPFGNNQIIIEREERKEKPKDVFILNNNAILNKNENDEKEELKKLVDNACEENDQLKNEINNLKKYIKSIKKKIDDEIEEREQKLKIKFEKIIIEAELKIKELEHIKDDLIKEKNELNEKLQKAQTLMEEKNEKIKKEMNDMNKLMQKQKEEIEKKNNEIINLNNLKDKLMNEKDEIIRQKEQVINERDQLMVEKQQMEEQMNNLEVKIRDYECEIEKYKQLQKDYKILQDKENEMNKEIEQLKGDKEKLNEQINDSRNEINRLEQNILDLNKAIEKEKNEKEYLKREIDDLTKEKEELINKNENLNKEIKTLNNQINILNNTIEELEVKIKGLKEDNNILYGRSPDDTSMIIGNYIYDFYKDILFNLINDIIKELSLDKIPDFLKKSFDLENINIFEESTYIKGVYPKIITVCSKSSKSITGICSIYYENYGQEGEPLILRIGALCVLEQDWEEKIENIINYIKEKMVFDEIKLIIKYIPNPEKGNKLMLNPSIKNLFKTKLNCNWKNITNLADGSRTQDVRFIKKGNYFDQEETEYKNNNNKIFGFNTLSILSLFNNPNEGGENLIKQIVSNFGYSRYINLLPIYILLANNPSYKMIFAKDSDSKIYEMPEDDEVEGNCVIKSINPRNQIKRISNIISNINDVSELKEKINSSEILKNFDISDSLFEEITTKLQEKNIDNISYNYFSMNVNLSTQTNLCLEFEDYYYNRISSKDIDILRDTETKNLFYLIPTKTESTFLLICQVGRKLQKELLDGNKNIYQTFMEYHPKLTSQLLQFSSFGLMTSQLKDTEKVIYIPSFKIDSHLYSYSVNDINKKGTIIHERSGKDGTVGSVEEYFSMSFEPDKNIKNSFGIIPVEDKKMNVVIREPFLFCVFNINIFSNTPLQLFYVTKDHWIKAEKNTDLNTNMLNDLIS